MRLVSSIDTQHHHHGHYHPGLQIKENHAADRVLAVYSVVRFYILLDASENLCLNAGAPQHEDDVACRPLTVVVITRLDTPIGGAERLWCVVSCAVHTPHAPP